MPFSFTIEPDGLIVVIGSGEGERQAWLGTMFHAMSDRRYRYDAPILMDMTRLTSAPPAIYVTALAEDVRSLLPANRIAVVATLPAVTLLAEQVGLLTGDRLAVFTSEPEARRWLRET